MKRNKKSESISTFLGSDSKIDGILEFQGMIRIDGKVKGRIHSSNGTVIVGEKAVIDADMVVTAPSSWERLTEPSTQWRRSKSIRPDG
jgi:cytoskeletal protein CcmA (bactofilin family)